MKQTRNKNIEAIIFCLVTVVFLYTNGRLAAQSGAAKTYKLGFSKDIFLNVPPKDGMTAVKNFIDTMHEEPPLKNRAGVKFETRLFSSAEDILSALIKKDVDYVFLNVTDFLYLKKTVELIPALTSRIGSGDLYRYVLVVAKKNDFKNISNLSNKNLAAPPFNQHPFINIWISDLLMQNNLDSIEKFFNQVYAYEKESNAVHSVFFNSNHCAVVTLNGFETICGQNPQLRESLKIIEVSPAVPVSISCYPKGCDESLIEIMKEVAGKFGDTAQGKLILKIFSADLISQIEESELESVTKLYNQYLKISGQKSQMN